MKECNNNVLNALKMAEEMILLSEKGSSDSEDDSCIMLYGVIRDTAYRIKQLAENEIRKHNNAGRWD